MTRPPTVGILHAKRSTTSVEGVMGHPAANRAPAARVPSQQAWSPSRKWTPVRTPLGSACLSFSEDGEVGTIHSTEVAAGACGAGDDRCWLVSLCVISRGKRQDVGGAEFDT